MNMTSNDAAVYIDIPRDDTWHVLVELTLSSKPDHGPLSIDPVMKALCDLNVPVQCLEQLQQHMSEALRNAIQHKEKPGPEETVFVRVLVPNGETRQIERQSPGSQGCFLIEGTAHTSGAQAHRVIELFVYREGGKDEH
jgi:hypothetical protein